MKYAMLPLAFSLLLPLAGQVHAGTDKGIREELADANKEMTQGLADARKEMRAELAQARIELQTENLELGNNLNFSKSGKNKSKQRNQSLPKAEITPKGELLIEGKPVATDMAQRKQLLTYRGQVIEIAMAGIDIGERSAQAAIDAVDRGLFSLMLSAFTGNLERKIEKTVKETVEPGVRQICRTLPGLLETQQRLAASVPEFQPYATLEADDVDDCEDEVRREFAAR